MNHIQIKPKNGYKKFEFKTLEMKHPFSVSANWEHFFKKEIIP